MMRLNVNLNTETADALKAIVEERGCSYTEAVRRAIAIYKFIEDETEAGNVIFIGDGRDRRELVLL